MVFGIIENLIAETQKITNDGKIYLFKNVQSGGRVFLVSASS